MEKYNIKPIHNLYDFETIKDIWQEIYNTVTPNSIFISYDYIMLWYRSFADPYQVRIYPVFYGEDIVGFAPLLLEKKGLICYLKSLTNLHSYHPSTLIAKGHEEIFSKNCLNAVSTDKSWDVLQFYYYSFQQGICIENNRKDDILIVQSEQPTYSILLPRSFDEYFQKQFSSTMRNKLRKISKRLLDVPKCEYCRYTGKEAINFWETFMSIEDSGWKGNKKSSIKYLPQNYRSYYEGLLKLLCENNKLYMYALFIDGNPVAATFNYIDKDIFHGWKSGYIEEFSSFSPSIALLLYMIEDIINNLPEIKRFHMFPNDFGYKHRYANEPSYYSEIKMYNDTIIGKAVYNWSRSKKIIKRLPGMSAAIKYARDHFMKED